MSLKDEMDAFVRKHAKGPWKDAGDFMGYVSMHSQSELARFHVTQIATMLHLAGMEEESKGWFETAEQFPDMFRSVDMSELVDKAYARLKVERDRIAKEEKAKRDLLESTEGAGI